MNKKMTTEFHGAASAKVIEHVKTLGTLDINDQICILKTAAAMLDNELSSAILAHAVSSVFSKK